jgi:hypothetical protein
MALAVAGGGVREICLRLVPAAAEAPEPAERGLFYPIAGSAVRPRSGPRPQERLPGREQRLAYYDPYRRGGAELRP